ncbi:MAG: hypothetical protein KJO07_06545 [Deltaproteobacteria bacterium]|nr:hypothetical protein [Deltaproteobacteria bacterium]
MRTVSAEDGRLVVTDDPNDSIATLLDYAAHDRADQAGAFSPEGDGFAAPSIVSAVRVTKPEDIPLGWDEHIPFEPDVWVIFKDKPDGSGMHIAWLRGEELRKLFEQAQRVLAGRAKS